MASKKVKASQKNNSSPFKWSFPVEPVDTERKTATEWQETSFIRVVNPTGWTDGFDSWDSEKITHKDFVGRCIFSTTIPNTDVINDLQAREPWNEPTHYKGANR